MFKSTRIYVNRQQMYENQLKSQKINQNHTESMRIDENRQKNVISKIQLT